MPKILAGILAVLFSAVQLAFTAEVDYARDVKPIFKERCFACHGVLKQESGLRLDNRRWNPVRR